MRRGGVLLWEEGLFCFGTRGCFGVGGGTVLVWEERVFGVGGGAGLVWEGRVF